MNEPFVEMVALADHYVGLYLIAPTDEGPTKVGISGNLHERANSIQIGAWLPLKIYAFRLAMFKRGASRYPSMRNEFYAAACAVEATTHQTLRDLEFGLSGEWFDVTPREALLVMKKCAEIRDAGILGVEELAGIDLVGRPDVSMMRSRNRLVRGLAQINSYIRWHNEMKQHSVDQTIKK